MQNKTTENRPLILVTNDDGVRAKGIKSLINIALQFGEVVVMAPDRSQSGQSHSITVESPLYVRKHTQEPHLQIYSTNGKPADCVKLAIHKVLDRKPDLVLSGINHGSNSSVSVIYSGTMAAAIEGCLNGIPSVGLSVADYAADADFSAVEAHAPQVIADVLKNGLPEGICLNVNVPAIEPQNIKGIKICRQTHGRWVEDFLHRQTPHQRDYYWLTGVFENYEPTATDTDEWALANQYVSVVPVKIDFTATQFVDELSKRFAAGAQTQN